MCVAFCMQKRSLASQTAPDLKPAAASRWHAYSLCVPSLGAPQGMLIMGQQQLLLWSPLLLCQEPCQPLLLAP